MKKGKNRVLNVVGLDGLEPTTSVLSGPRSNHLSYRPTLIDGDRGETPALYPVATSLSRAGALSWSLVDTGSLL